MWKNSAEPDRPLMTIIRRTRFACWITKATDTHSEYVILTAFQLQQWLRERAAILRLYINCFSCFTPSWCPTAAMFVPMSKVSNTSVISNRNHFTLPHSFSLFFRMCLIFSKRNYSTRVTNCSKDCKKAPSKYRTLSCSDKQTDAFFMCITTQALQRAVRELHWEARTLPQ